MPTFKSGGHLGLEIVDDIWVRRITGRFTYSKNNEESPCELFNMIDDIEGFCHRFTAVKVYFTYIEQNCIVDKLSLGICK